MDSPAGTILILLTGVCIVVGGILIFRLHAFLALMLAALTVAVLTPSSTRERIAIEKASAKVLVRNDDSIIIATGNPPLRSESAVPAAGIRPGELYLLLRKDAESSRYEPLQELVVRKLQATPDGSSPRAVLMAAGDAQLEAPQPDDLVVQPIALQAARKSVRSTIGARAAAGFGSTCVAVGILIAMAGIVGKCLLDSGAADRIVRTMLRWFGEPGTPLAFMFSGFLLGVPVFFDTVFYLMIPIGKAMRLRTGRNYLLYVLTIVCGGTMAHSLVPPTPGPLFAAEALGVDLGTMILGGILVGLVASTSGYLFAAWLNRRCELPLRDTEDFSLEEVTRTLEVDESELPPFWLAIQPIILPVVLIAGLTTLQEMEMWKTLDPNMKLVCETLGEKNVALTLAALVSIGLVIRRKRGDRTALSDAMQKSLASAGTVVLITCAGGAFGALLSETGVVSLVRKLDTASPQMLCTLAFLITVAIRTAQGSATVAMITACGVLKDIDLSFSPLYLALAVGCGSKPIAWMNDSGFWVMTRMSGMSEREGLRYITPMTAIMGVVGLLAVLVGVTLWPNI